MNAVVQQRQQHLQELRPDAAESFGEDVGAQQQHGANFFLGQRLADTTCMAAHQILLECPHFARLDADIGELAEAGVHAIRGLTAPEQAIHDGARRLDARQGCGIERSRTAAHGNFGNFFQREWLASQQQRR